MAECCVHGIREVRDQLVGNENALQVLRGLVNKTDKIFKENPNIGVRELTEQVKDEPVTFDDYMGVEGMEPIHFYSPERDAGIVQGTDLRFPILAMAVATCVTRCDSNQCQILMSTTKQEGSK